MGYSFTVKCENCDYSFIANVGHGMCDCGFLEKDPETKKPYFYSYFNDKCIIDDICTLLKTKKNIREDEDSKINRNWNGHGSAQYVCTKCGHLHNNFYFRLVFEGGAYEPEYSCDKCKGKLTLIDIENIKAVNWRCPLCRHNKLIKDDNAPEILYD